MNVKYTSGLVLLLVGILGIPLAVLFYRELNSAAPTPTPQIRLLDSPLVRITASVPEAKRKDPPKPKSTRNPKRTPTPIPTATLTPVPPTPTPTPTPTREFDFDEPIQISGSAGITGWAARAEVDGQGTIHAAWLSTPSPSSVMYSSKPAGGAWSLPYNVSGGTLGVLRQDLAVSLDGTVHVVWRQFEEVDNRGFDRVFYSSRAPNGLWTSPEDIDQTDVDIDDPPVVAVDSQGRVHVVWGATHTSKSDTVGWSTPAVIATNIGAAEGLISGPDGTLHMVTNKGGVIHYVQRAADGVWGDAEVVATDESQGQSPSFPFLDRDGAGVLHAAWKAKPEASNTDKLFYSSKSPGGSWSVPVVVNPVGSASHINMQVFSSGEAVATWVSGTTDIGISALHTDGTWLPAVTVAQGSWPVVAPENSDTIHLFFSSGAQLFYARSQ